MGINVPHKWGIATSQSLSGLYSGWASVGPFPTGTITYGDFVAGCLLAVSWAVI